MNDVAPPSQALLVVDVQKSGVTGERAVRPPSWVGWRS